MVGGSASLSLHTLTSTVPCTPLLAISFLFRANIWTRTSRIVPIFRVSLLASSIGGATIVRLRNRLSSHGSSIIVLHKDIIVLFSYVHGANELMKPCDTSCIYINPIIL
ncbi:hypothetical protein RchiOBHm_Chr3g0491571 [Rosa chinensis]|uniref:Uncharacterized protein n=1 Tax=Rosa chinensis TaxID=74649 RepID=A0A2P6RGB0_ROSCH|nr:hypothetical protein RchiOBHm_Chr3g0491571 [Rosa chinensis]